MKLVIFYKKVMYRKERYYLEKVKNNNEIKSDIKYRRVWWLYPSKLIIGFIIPIYIILGVSYSNKDSIDIALNYFNDLFIIGLIILLIFYIGSFMGERINIRKKDLNFKFYLNSIYLDLLFILTIFAYILWFHKILIKPSIILDLLSGDGTTMYYIRNTCIQVEGVTTLTQLGVVYAIFFMLVQTKKINSNCEKRHFIYLFIILFFTLFRSLAWSERLALLEVLIPVIIIIMSKIKRKSFFIRFAPYIGIIMLLFYFGVFEYFRSWAGHYKYIYDSYSEFVIDRVSSYYITALNNGAGIFSIYGVSKGLGSFFASLYKIPFIGHALSQVLYPENNKYAYLYNYANLEFNNSSGIYEIIIQLGIPLGILFTMGLGILIGLMFNQFKNCNGIGIFMYPLLYIGIIEILRLFYFTETRTLYIYIFILIGYILFIKKNYNKA